MSSDTVLLPPLPVSLIYSTPLSAIPKSGVRHSSYFLPTYVLPTPYQALSFILFNRKSRHLLPPPSFLVKPYQGPIKGQNLPRRMKTISHLCQNDRFCAITLPGLSLFSTDLCSKGTPTIFFHYLKEGRYQKKLYDLPLQRYKIKEGGKSIRKKKTWCGYSEAKVRSFERPGP
jgi:hypothetical protein